MFNSVNLLAPTTPGFEGPEKKLELEFHLRDKDSQGLRTLTQEQWQAVLDDAQCHILSRLSNDYVDAFVLSESSLFVYRHKLMLKTCGTTTLLCVIPKVLEHAKALGMELYYVQFTRKSLNFPTSQKPPHRTFEEEVKYLDQYFDGQAYAMGPLKTDHWLVYHYDTREVGSHPTTPEADLEIMMHDLSPEKMRQFYQNGDHGGDVKVLTRACGIEDLIPNSKIDDFLFEPCGYSMNGLRDDALWTIHITPESHCSYVSFETNAHLDSYTELITNVLATFCPGRFTVTVFADETALPAGVVSTLHSFEHSLPGYRLTDRTFHEFEGTCDLTMCNFVKDQPASATA